MKINDQKIIFIIIIVICFVSFLCIYEYNNTIIPADYNNELENVKLDLSDEINSMKNVLEKTSIMLVGYDAETDLNSSTLKQILNSTYTLTTPTFDVIWVNSDNDLIYTTAPDNLINHEINRVPYIAINTNDTLPEYRFTEYQEIIHLYENNNSKNNIYGITINTDDTLPEYGSTEYQETISIYEDNNSKYNIYGSLLAIPIEKNDKYNGYIAVTIDISGLIEKISSKITLNNDYSFYVIDNKFNIIYSKKTNDIGSKIKLSKENDIMKKIEKWDTGSIIQNSKTNEKISWTTLKLGDNQKLKLIISTNPFDNNMIIINNKNDDIIRNTLLYRAIIYAYTFGIDDAKIAYNNRETGIFKIGKYYVNVTDS